MASARVVTLIDHGSKRKGGGRGGDGGAPPADADWRDLLTRGRDERVEGTLHNLLMIMEHDRRMRGLFWLNDSSNQLLLSRPAPWPGSNRLEFVDTDSSELAAWLQHPDCYGMRCSDEMVLKAVIAVARRYRRHPIRDYLQGLTWDGVPRVESMLIDLFGAKESRYARQAALCFMVGAVARVLWVDPKNPALGAKVDFMLVLEGEQNRGKSTALMELFGSSAYVETIESPTGKDFWQLIQGCWGVEIGEMNSFGKADVTAVKVAITRRTDKFRAPYERLPSSYRRECVFVGTSNEREYLRDPTGGRRFLPVFADRDVDVGGVVALRDQLWAEAVALFSAGFAYWVLPEDAKLEQSARYIHDSWEGRIERWLAGKFASDGNGILIAPTRLLPYHNRPIPWTTTDELLVYAIGIEPGRHTRADQMRVAQIMRLLGKAPIPDDDEPEDTWDHARRRWPDGGRDYRWVRISAASTDQQPSSSDAGGGDAPDF